MNVMGKSAGIINICKNFFAVVSIVSNVSKVIIVNKCIKKDMCFLDLGNMYH